MDKNTLVLSSLPKTWLIDLDGKIVKHNGAHTVDGAKRFMGSIPDADVVIFVTARKELHKEVTENFLRQNKI